MSAAVYHGKRIFTHFRLEETVEVSLEDQLKCRKMVLCAITVVQ